MFQNLETMIIRFSVFGTPDENLALVFDLLHQTLCRMLDITSPKKMILEGEIKDANLSSF